MDKTILESMKHMLKVQGADGNWNYDEYMLGLYNGMEFMVSIAEGREPVFRSRPEEYVKYTHDFLNVSKAVKEYE